MKYIYYSIVSIILLTTLNSCGPKVVYHQEYNIGGNWSYDEPIDFSFEIIDSLQKYDLMLTVDHSADYSYQNFYTKITTTYPTKEIFVNSLSIELANKMGSWLSTCSGENCQLNLLLRHDVKFKDLGQYNISFSQDTRDPHLKGINTIGLSLLEAEK